MDYPEGAGSQRADRVDFDHRARLDFRGTQLSSDGGLLVMRKLPLKGYTTRPFTLLWSIVLGRMPI
jgi:hypothetical protein